ncbi:UNVERIFIED_CONTAM: hypothetical protein FKN15_032169 [Acipenser sinensis]
MAGRSYKKLMEFLKTTRKPLDLEDINTLFLEDYKGMDPLEEDQLDEELMMEEGRDEEEESVPDKPQPSSSTVKSAPAHYSLTRYTLAHTTTATPDAPVHVVDEESDTAPGFFTNEDADLEAPRPLPFRPSCPVGVDIPMVTHAL